MTTDDGHDALTLEGLKAYLVRREAELRQYMARMPRDIAAYAQREADAYLDIIDVIDAGRLPE